MKKYTIPTAEYMLFKTEDIMVQSENGTGNPMIYQFGDLFGDS